MMLMMTLMKMMLLDLMTLVLVTLARVPTVLLLQFGHSYMLYGYCNMFATVWNTMDATIWFLQYYC